eukprot:2782329-Ditylum_brightwellii.AAC.1
MHIGENDGTSKTGAIIFVAPGKVYRDYDTSSMPVSNGYITYTCKFKYFGSILSWDLNDQTDLENCSLQAHKALQAIMPTAFCNPDISLHVKHMLCM